MQTHLASGCLKEILGPFRPLKSRTFILSRRKSSRELNENSRARADLSAEFEQAVAEIRIEASLESKGHTLMNNQVIEHLELELTRKKQDMLRMEQMLEEKQSELTQEIGKTQEREEENLKLRSLLEKSGQTVSYFLPNFFI